MIGACSRKKARQAKGREGQESNTCMLIMPAADERVKASQAARQRNSPDPSGEIKQSHMQQAWHAMPGRKSLFESLWWGWWGWGGGVGAGGGVCPI